MKSSQIPTTEPTPRQRTSSTRLTEIISPQDLSSQAPLIKKLERVGFSLVLSEPAQTSYSILMPSGRVLDVRRQKALLDNASPSGPNDETSGACLYYGFYLNYFSRIHGGAHHEPINNLRRTPSIHGSEEHVCEGQDYG